MSSNDPRVLLISQWPNVRNGEFELIEKIRQTGFKIAVTDYLGFDVSTGQCINNDDLAMEYDFAISFHYDTPKFLNIPTLLWVANPLEFMHLRGDYRTTLLHHLRSYDDYLFNGSSHLKGHIKRTLGSEWRDSNLEFFASCSRKAMIPPRASDAANTPTSNMLFYCGVNWEKGIDRAGRAQGLLDILQEKRIADFYGPRTLEGIDPWAGFSSYKGEIPFDGISMSTTMRNYGAVLAVSSPAHIKSQTSSSRVFEGFAAGVPVISDENHHVQHLFGDLVYYFGGKTEQERAESIITALERIRTDPAEANERVRQAQEMIATRYCFEECLTKAKTSLAIERIAETTPDSINAHSSAGATIDVFLFHHDPYVEPNAQTTAFGNISHIISAATAAADKYGAEIRIFCYDPDNSIDKQEEQLPPAVKWSTLNTEQVDGEKWKHLQLGEKFLRMASLSSGDFAVFLTQADYPQYDYLIKPLAWSAGKEKGKLPLYVGGFYSNDLSSKAPPGTSGILRNNTSSGLYRWTQNSIAEHQLGQYCFSKVLLESLDIERIKRFDVLFPIALLLEAQSQDISIYRARHLLLRVTQGYFHNHYAAYSRAVTKGFWAQHYELLSNYSHELNGLYDAFHEFPEVIAIVDKVSGHALPPAAPVDPAIHRFNQLLKQLRPIYRILKRARSAINFKRT